MIQKKDMTDAPMKIVYCTPAIYSAGGVERVVTLKASYFAEQYGYDVTIIVTEGKGRDSFFPLSNKVKVINLAINFEELWTCPFIQKIFVYLKKQHLYKKMLYRELQRIRPDITISTLRREINFINDIADGGKKKIMFAAFGTGMSLGAVLIDLEKPVCKMIDYPHKNA